MATPRPIRATRYCTRKLTSVTAVSPKMARNAARMATAATSSGTSASSDPNTNASTTRAPTPPASVSTSTPVSPGRDSASAASSSIPVTSTDEPAGRAARSRSVTAGVSSEAPASTPRQGPRPARRRSGRRPRPGGGPRANSWDSRPETAPAAAMPATSTSSQAPTTTSLCPSRNLESCGIGTSSRVVVGSSSDRAAPAGSPSSGEERLFTCARCADGAALLRPLA